LTIICKNQFILHSIIVIIQASKPQAIATAI